MRKIFASIMAMGLALPLSAQLQQSADSCFQAWNKPFASAEEIINEYKAHPHATVFDDCCMIWQAGEYICGGKGEQQDIRQLLSSFPSLDLTSDSVRAFMQVRKVKVKGLVGHYYLLKGLQKGYSFDEARDGVFFTVYFPFRAPSRNDYEKMTYVFSTTCAELHEPFLKNFEFLMMNHGCTDGLEALRPLIEKNVADGELKRKVLGLYAQYEPLRRGMPAPKSVLKDAEEREFTLADFRGKTVIVDVWASWCGSCLEKMPVFASLHDKYAKSNDAVFVLLSTDRNKSLAAWEKNMEKYKDSGMKILRADVENGSSFETDYCVSGLPRYIVIDSNGNIRDAFAPKPGSGLEAIVEETILQPLKAQDTISTQGIHFEDLSLKEALAKAGREGKKVFVDCYTQTCGPCKYMMKNIFPLAECGDYFNPRYVSLARDMDVDEGPEMRRKYGVGIYPTFLIINPDGSLYCKEIGAVRLNSKVSFVDKMKRAVERTELGMKYEAGNRDGQLVRRYAELLRGSGNQKADQIVNDYLMGKTDEELCEEGNWKMLVAEVSSPESPVFRRLLGDREAFGRLLGRQIVTDKLVSIYRNDFEMRKMMGIDFGSRISDLRLLEKEGCPQARQLAECMTLRWIINDKLTRRIGEIVTILQQLGSLSSDSERMAVVKELNGFERIADAGQRNAARKALENVKKTMGEADSAAIAKVISRITPGK